MWQLLFRAVWQQILSAYISLLNSILHLHPTRCVKAAQMLWFTDIWQLFTFSCDFVSERFLYPITITVIVKAHVSGTVLELSMGKPALSLESFSGVGSFPSLTKTPWTAHPRSPCRMVTFLGASGKVLCSGIFSSCSLMLCLSELAQRREKTVCKLRGEGLNWHLFMGINNVVSRVGSEGGKVFWERGGHPQTGIIPRGSRKDN